MGILCFRHKVKTPSLTPIPEGVKKAKYPITAESRSEPNKKKKL